MLMLRQARPPRTTTLGQDSDSKLLSISSVWPQISTHETKAISTFPCCAVQEHGRAPLFSLIPWAFRVVTSGLTCLTQPTELGLLEGGLVWALPGGTSTALPGTSRSVFSSSF